MGVGLGMPWAGCWPAPLPWRASQFEGQDVHTAGQVGPPGGGEEEGGAALCTCGSSSRGPRVRRPPEGAAGRGRAGGSGSGGGGRASVRSRSAPPPALGPKLASEASSHGSLLTAASSCSAAAGHVQLLQALDTGFTADAVEWCPLPGYRRLLACGTYQLQQEGRAEVRARRGVRRGVLRGAPGPPDSRAFVQDEDEPREDKPEDGEESRPPERLGRLYLYRAQEVGHSVQLQEVYRRDTKAVLDIKWCAGAPSRGIQGAEAGQGRGAVHARG